jgi:hypothetical protein
MHGQIVGNDGQDIGGSVKAGQKEDEKIGGNLLRGVLLFTL